MFGNKNMGQSAFGGFSMAGGNKTVTPQYGTVDTGIEVDITKSKTVHRSVFVNDTDMAHVCVPKEYETLYKEPLSEVCVQHRWGH